MPQRTQSPSPTPATVDDGVLVRQGLSSDAVAERIALGLTNASSCLLYTSDAADDAPRV